MAREEDMVQASGRGALVGMLGAVLLGLVGCSSGRSTAKVEDAWLARVPPEGMEAVHKARLTQNKAVDETTRVQVALEDAKRALEVAKENQRAAESRREADEAALLAARATAQTRDIVRAQQTLREADLELSVAKAEVEFRERVVATREALQRMRERELAVADAELAQTEYLALVRSGDARARQLSGEDFQNALERARGEAWETQRQVDALLQRQRQAQAVWQRLDEQTRAYGGSGR
jgi:colicin import membrane protein